MALLRIFILLIFTWGLEGRVIPVKYAGCFIAKEAEESNPEHTGRSGPFTVQGKFSGPTDIQKCVYSCFGRSFKFAGLQNSNRCFCGSTLFTGLRRLHEESCNKRCHGNEFQYCGGLVAMSVYETGFQRGPDLSFSWEKQMKEFMGCFPGFIFKLMCVKQIQQKPILKSPMMTPQMCASYCLSGTTYVEPAVAILKNTEECCCGGNKRAVLSVASVHSKMCNLPCAGQKADNLAKCSGKPTPISGGMFISVYDIPAGESFEHKDNASTAAVSVQAQLHVQRAEEVKLLKESAVKGNKSKRGVNGEVNTTKPTDTAEMLGELPGGEELLHGQPIIDPENTGVKVVDVPELEEEEEGSAVAITLSFLACLLLCAAIGLVLFKKKKRGAASKDDTGSEKDKLAEKGDVASTSDQPTSMESDTTTNALESDTTPNPPTSDDESSVPLL